MIGRKAGSCFRLQQESQRLAEGVFVFDFFNKVDKRRATMDVEDLAIKAKWGRLNINLPVDVLVEIKQLANKEHITVTELVRRAVKAEKFMREQEELGNDILIRENGKQEPTKIVRMS